MTVQTTNSAVSINPFTAGNTYILPAGVYVASDNSTAIFSFANGTLDIGGSVYGFGGIRVGTLNGITSTIAIAATGSVIGTGAGGIELDCNYSVTNAGTILGPRDSGGAAVLIFGGSGSIVNSGTIMTSGPSSKAVVNVDFGVCSLTNTGTISGSSNGYAFFGGSSTDEITNGGTMTGIVLTGAGADTVINYGHIYGNIDMGADSDTLYTDLNQLGPYTLAGGAGSDTLANLDNDHTASVNLGATGFEIFYGGAMASYVYGGTATAALTFVGKGGMDAFIGGSGNDVAIGGAGGDYLDGGAGTSNTLSYSTSLQGVTVNLGAGTSSGGDAAGDVFLNFQNLSGSAAGDVLVGSAGANTIVGDAGNDYMFGAGGADLLIGGAGNDYLSGGAGNDIFYYSAPGFGSDEITDFTIGQDKMYISTSIAANFAGMVIFQYGADAYVGAGGTYFHLDNTLATSLAASDFVFF
jgi:RTX calcium-binding nonapeptide repeat (4 copies)